MRTLALLGILLLSSVVNAATLYTGPVDAPYGQELGCEFVNVNGTTFVSTISIVDGDDNTVVSSYTCSTGPTQPGCAISYSTLITDSGFFYCKFEIAPSSKTAIRGRAVTYNPTAHSFEQAGDAN